MSRVVVATISAATALVTRAGAGAAARRVVAGSPAAARTCSPIRAALALAFTPLLLLLLSSPAAAASNKVRLTKLADVNFGTVASLGSDAVQSQSVCLYADTNTNGYDVTAIGTGAGGAFQLTSGLSSMAYEVQWSGSSGQSSGIRLDPNVPLTGQTSAASQQTCNNGPATSASLIVMLRSTALSSATAGTYNGTLTLIIGAE